MRLFAIPATSFVALILISLQLPAADFGDLLGQFPFLTSSGEAAEPPVDPADSAEAVPLSGSAQADAPQADAAQPAPLNPPDLDEANPIEGNPPSPEPARGARSHSPIPPPHIPDETTGMRCESVLEQAGDEPMAMIESDAARAAESTIPPPVLPSVDSVPQTVDFGQLLVEPCVVPGDAGIDEAAGPTQYGQPVCHGGAECVQPQPAPYIYTGPGLPPPASLETFRRTPECYRGLWDGFAEERYRRCECCHRHLHGQCDCHRGDCRSCPPAVSYDMPHSMPPAGICAKRPAADAPTMPAVTR